MFDFNSHLGRLWCAAIILLWVPIYNVNKESCILSKVVTFKCHFTIYSPAVKPTSLTALETNFQKTGLKFPESELNTSWVTTNSMHYNTAKWLLQLNHAKSWTSFWEGLCAGNSQMVPNRVFLNTFSQIIEYLVSWYLIIGGLHFDFGKAYIVRKYISWMNIK